MLCWRKSRGKADTPLPALGSTGTCIRTRVQCLKAGMAKPPLSKALSFPARASRAGNPAARLIHIKYTPFVCFIPVSRLCVPKAICFFLGVDGAQLTTVFTHFCEASKEKVHQKNRVTLEAVLAPARR